MKWWIVGAAVITLVVAGASVWFGSGASATLLAAQYLYNASVILACLAIGLAIMDAYRSRRNNAGIALTVLVGIVGIAAILHNWPGLDIILGAGPYCGRYLTYDSFVCVQRASFVAEIYHLAPVFAIPVAGLMYTFWPRKQNTFVMAGHRK